MSKDRFDRLDEDIFEKAPAPPVQVTGTRFTREDILERARTQVELLRASGVTVDPATVASIRESEDQRILDEVVRAAQGDPNYIVIDSLRATQCENCGRVVEGVCNCEFSDPHTVIEPGSEEPDDLPAHPQGWLFAIVPADPSVQEVMAVCFTPIAYFRTYRAQTDAHLEGEEILQYIPEYLTEVAESTFTMVNNTDAIGMEMVRDDLIARGFREDPNFTSIIVNGRPADPTYDQALAARADVIHAMHERDDHAVPTALVRTLGGQVIGLRETSRRAEQAVREADQAIANMPVVRPVTEDELERAQAHRRQAYGNLLNVRSPNMWLFTVTTHENGNLVLVLVHRNWWHAYASVPDVRVLSFLNDSLPHWVLGELQDHAGCFWIDDEVHTHPESAIHALQELGFVLLPALGPASGLT